MMKLFVFAAALIVIIIGSAVASAAPLSKLKQPKFDQLPYDPQRAVNGVYASKIAYCPADTIQTWTCGACPHFPRMVNITTAYDFEQDAQAWTGFVPPSPTSKNGQVIISFRGTTDLLGWLADFNFPQVEYQPSNLHANCSAAGFGKCMVHEGLYTSTMILMKTIFPAAQALSRAYPKADILCTGHSMGAGQVTLAFPMILLGVQCDGCKKEAYSYGTPRIVNPAFSQWTWGLTIGGGSTTRNASTAAHYHASNYGDPIPHIAPLIFDDLGLYKWIHTPREVFYPNPMGKTLADRRVYRISYSGNATHEDPHGADSSPWWSMIGFRNHTTYLGLELGCFL